MGRIHLDHNATTPLRPEVRALLLETSDRVRGNPSSLHAAGREARHLLDEARERCAAALGVHEDEVLFTSGGTEANNLALKGALRACTRDGGPGALAVSAIEHSSVLGAARALEREGHRLDWIEVDAQGMVCADEICTRAARSGWRLLSLHAANNEIGSVLPVAQIARGLQALAPEQRPLLHTDAVQALGRLPLDLEHVQLASFSAHKLGGPLGAGILVRRAGVALDPLAHGGEQEGGLRPGTENVPALVAAALAVELAVGDREHFAARLRELGLTLWNELSAALPGARLLGPRDDAQRLPGTLNVLLPGADGKVLVTRLDLEGLEASAGSACASGSLEPSHVLLALGLAQDEARAGLRLSLGRTTSAEEVCRAVEILRRSVGEARATSRARTSS